MRYITTLLITLVLVGCQTTQKTEATTVKEIVKVEADKPKLEAKEGHNPFKGIDIPTGSIITSTKPVICGRIDVVLSKMEDSFGEVPILVGKVPVQDEKGTRQVISTLTYNLKTQSYTFLEQMPLEPRIVCILSSGYGKLNTLKLGTAL